MVVSFDELADSDIFDQKSTLTRRVFSRRRVGVKRQSNLGVLRFGHESGAPAPLLGVCGARPP